jgi:hypothetical protein
MGVYLFMSKKYPRRAVKIRAKHELRGFMPRNIVTPYECRRHEVRGSEHLPDNGVWQTRKGLNPGFQILVSE